MLARLVGPFDTSPDALGIGLQFLDPARRRSGLAVFGGVVDLVFIIDRQIHAELAGRSDDVGGIAHHVRAAPIAPVEGAERQKVNPVLRLAGCGQLDRPGGLVNGSHRRSPSVMWSLTMRPISCRFSSFNPRKGRAGIVT